MEVVASEPGRVSAFGVGRSSRFDTIWRYELTALPDRRTDVHESFTLGHPLGPLSRLLTRATTGVTDRTADLEAGMRQTLEALATHAEAGLPS